MSLKKIAAILFVVIGIVSIIMSFEAYDLPTGGYESSSAYGGDAYTGIQNAAAQTANNVRYVTEAVGYVGGSLLMVTGLILIAVGVNTWPGSLNLQGLGLPFGQANAPTQDAPVQDAPADVFCPNCGAAQQPGTVFCANCGSKIN